MVLKPFGEGRRQEAGEVEVCNEAPGLVVSAVGELVEFLVPESMDSCPTAVPKRCPDAMACPLQTPEANEPKVRFASLVHWVPVA